MFWEKLVTAAISEGLDLVKGVVVDEIKTMSRPDFDALMSEAGKKLGMVHKYSANSYTIMHNGLSVFCQKGSNKISVKANSYFCFPVNNVPANVGLVLDKRSHNTFNGIWERTHNTQDCTVGYMACTDVPWDGLTVDVMVDAILDCINEVQTVHAMARG